MSFSEAEDALIKILRTWSDITEIVPLGEKWKQGVMILNLLINHSKKKKYRLKYFFIRLLCCATGCV